MIQTAPWRCPTCTQQVDTAFCPTCGEQSPGSRHLTLRELGHDALQAVSHLDGKILRTLRALVLSPGTLTAAYASGRRKPFMAPLSAFLAANGLFFAVQSASKINIFASSLDSHLNRQDWSPLARTLVTRRLQRDGLDLSDYAPLFDQAAVLHAKTLVILMPLVFCVVPALLFFRNRRPLAMHGVFALHLYAFLLLLFCLALAISAADVAIGGPGMAARWMDLSLSAFNLTICSAYLYRASGVVYGARGLARIAQTATMVIAVAALVLGYRFSIFLLTVWWI